MMDLDVGHLRRARHEVVHQRSRQQLALGVVHDVLVERGADALDDGAAHLLRDQGRVDHGPAVFDRDVPQNLHEPRLDVHLDDHHVHAVRPGDRPRRRVVRGGLEGGLEITGELVGLVVHAEADVGEGEAAIGGASHGDLPVPQLDVVGSRLEQVAGDPAHLLRHGPAGEDRRAGAEHGAATAGGAPAIRDEGGVAAHDVDVLDGHAELVGDDLRERRVRALPLIGDADERRDRPARLHAHRRRVLGRDRRAAAPVKRSRRRQLDEAGEPDAEVPSLAPAARLLLAPARVAALVERELERLEIAAALEDVAEGRGVRELVAPHQIPASDLHRIELQIPRGAVEHRLHHHRGDRMAHRAVLGHQRLVLRDDVQLGLVVADPVRTREEPDDLIALHHAGARVAGPWSHARDRARSEAEHGPVGAHGRLDVDEVLAAMDVGRERLETIGDPLHRPSQPHGEQAGGDVVGVAVDLEAEAAADVRRDDTDLLFRQPQDAREDRLHHVRHLARDPHAQRSLTRLVGGHEAPGLERDARLAADDEAIAVDAMRAGEGLVDLALVEAAAVDHVVTQLLVDQRRPGTHRGFGIHDGRQRLVLDLHEVTRVLGDVAVGGGDGHDGLADVPDLVEGQRVLQGGLHPDVVGENPTPRVAQPRRLVGGEDGDDPGQRERPAHAHVTDARVRVRAPHERGVDHPWQVEVVDEPALPGEQAAVFHPLHGSADRARPRARRRHQRAASRGGAARSRAAAASTASTIA